MRPLTDLLPLFAGKKILVVGDLFLDEYIVGRPARISREAPAMVLEFQRRYSLPGGATSPARNITSLGGHAYQVGLVGADEEGRQLRQSLANEGVDVAGMLVNSSRPTTTKTRIVAEGFLVFPQQLVRVDRTDRQPMSPPVEASMLAYLERSIPDMDGVLFSDYKCGVVNDRLVEAAVATARRHGKLLTVDSQGDLHKFTGFQVVKCNQQEAEALLGRRLQNESDFETALGSLISDLDTDSMVITRGADGMSLMGRDRLYEHIPVTNRSEVFDVTGAGDAVIAVLTLALAAGATLNEAAHLANYAAGSVVRKWGNAAVSRDELAEAVHGSPLEINT